MYNITSKILSLAFGLMPILVLTVKHGVNIAAAIILLVSIIMLFIHFPTSIKLSHLERIFIFAMLCLPLIILADVMLRDFRLRYFDYYARFIIVLPIFFALRQAKVNVKYFAISLSIGSVGAGLLAIYQWLYFDVNNVHGFVIKISFGNISLLLGMMSLASLFLIDKVHYKKIFIISCLLAFFMGMTASILSGSRGGWIALPFFITLFLTYFTPQKLYKLSSALLLTSIMMVTYYANDNVKARVDLVSVEMNNYFSANKVDNLAIWHSSVGQRLEVWRAAWSMFMEHPVIGVGSGKFKAVLQEKIAAGEIAKISAFDHAHSEPLHLLAIIGIIGFVGYGILYGGLIYFFHRSLVLGNSNELRYLSFLGLMLTGGSLIFGLTNYSFGHQVNVVFLAVMAAGIAGMLSSLECEKIAYSRTIV